MTEIAKIVQKAVERQGVIAFAEFMRLALYCPKYGYYEQPAGPVGRERDYYTNVSVGSLFSEILAFQFAEWLESLSGKAFQLVEAGANDGQLAAEVLAWLRQHRPSLLESFRYWIIEPSDRLHSRQKAKLEHFAGQVLWFDSLRSLPEASVNGIIFSNELLDAMPVHRLGWDISSGRWFEWGVTIKDARLVWTKIWRDPGFLAEELNQAGLELPAEALAALPDEFTIEICPEAAAWWRQAALALNEGKLLTIDYGFSADQYLTPERPGGTLRGYRHHCPNADVLAQVGEQDLTAHINFTQLLRAGEAAGLRTDGLFSQERFLTTTAAKILGKPSCFGEWTPARLRQFQTLTHPEQLGQRFSVLLQTRE